MFGALPIQIQRRGLPWVDGKYVRRMYEPDAFLLALLNLRRLIRENYAVALEEMVHAPETAMVEAWTKAILGDERPFEVFFIGESSQQDGGVFIGGGSSRSTDGQLMREDIVLQVRVMPPETDNLAVYQMVCQLHRTAITNILCAAPVNEFGRLPDATTNYQPSQGDRPVIELVSLSTGDLVDDITLRLRALVTQL